MYARTAGRPLAFNQLESDETVGIWRITASEVEVDPLGLSFLV